MTNLQVKNAIKKVRDLFSEKELEYENAKQKLIKTNKTYSELTKEYKDKVIKNALNPNSAFEKSIKQIELKLLDMENKANIKKPTPSCKECNDTGYVNSKLCVCVKQIINSELIKKCNIAEINLKNFSDCNFDGLDEKTKKAQQKIYKFFENEIINNFKNTKYKNVVVCGVPGVGKTFLFSVVAGELLKKNISTIYLSAFSLNNLFLKYHTTFDLNKVEILEPVLNCECLLIDDLGTEPILNNVTGEYLLYVLKERVMSGKVTLINSNLLLDKINERYGERIFSRLVDKSNSIALYMEGKNKRI